MWAYSFAYILSLLRLPFAVFPYLVKLALFLCLKDSFSSFWNKYFIQAMRMVGDFANFLILVVLFSKSYQTFELLPVRIVLVFAITAEAIRLATEKGTMIFSVMWQC